MKFEWTLDCERIFQHLKNLIKISPILNIVDTNKYFIVCTNACKEGLGGVLSQNGQVVCYESRKLNENEQNYVTHDLDLVVIIHTLNISRPYLLGRRFVLMNNHSGLMYLFDQPNLNVRKARWLFTISEFDFEIRHIKGKVNKVTHSLSRRV